MEMLFAGLLSFGPTPLVSEGKKKIVIMMGNHGRLGDWINVWSHGVWTGKRGGRSEDENLTLELLQSKI